MPSKRDLALVKAALEASYRALRNDGWGSAAQDAIIKLDPATIVASQHICLVCGRTKPCTETPEACTFDPTPEEIYADNIRLRQCITELERQLAETCGEVKQ